MSTTPHRKDNMTRDELAALPLLLTVNQVQKLGVGSTRTVRRMCERRVLKARKVGTTWRINRDSVIDYFDLLDANEDYRQRNTPRTMEHGNRPIGSSNITGSRPWHATGGLSDLLDGLELIG